MVSGLKVDHVVVRYGEVTAVDRLTVEVAPGEIVAVIGASGSGKSSLLRAVAGLEPLAAGRVSWDGVDQSTVPTHKRGFAVMFQDGQLFPHLDVGANVGYALYKRRRRDREQRVAELLDLVGLPGYQERAIDELSGGQAQRVALARSLAAEPRLLLLDEPLSALDVGLREHLAEVLAAGLRATGTPAMYVTHDQDEAFTVADRVAVLERGRLLQIDTPARLWAEPASRRVAEFLGYRPLLETPEAVALGWLDAPLGTIAVGPDGLVSDPAGVAVEVKGFTVGRGEILYDVALPSGQPGRLRVRGETDPSQNCRVRLDPRGCAVLRPEQPPVADR